MESFQSSCLEAFQDLLARIRAELWARLKAFIPRLLEVWQELLARVPEGCGAELWPQLIATKSRILETWWTWPRCKTGWLMG